MVSQEERRYPATMNSFSKDPTASTRIRLSHLHSIEIAEGLRHLLEQPQENDFPVHSVSQKLGPDGRELVSTHLVIAGWKTRREFAAAEHFPIHFLKSYYPWTLHGDPRIEYENSLVASRILGSPPPIGFDDSSFRTAFIPGRVLSRLSPFTDVQPDESCLGIARETETATLIGLWRLAEEIYAQVEKLHAQRFIHGDLELHNVIVCTAPVRALLIDFESSTPDFQGSDEEFEERRFRDLFELYRLAVFLQSGLGRQEGKLARESLEAIPRLFRASSTFSARLDAVDRRVIGA